MGKKTAGLVLAVTGAVLIISALLLFFHNLQEDQHAGDHVGGDGGLNAGIGVQLHQLGALGIVHGDVGDGLLELRIAHERDVALGHGGEIGRAHV